MTAQSRRKIGLLAGTFDPIHSGHTALARAAIGQGLDEVWFVVDPKRRSSKSERKRTVATFKQRLQMVRLALQDEPKIVMYEGPLVEKAHTSALFSELMDSNDTVDFSFVMGADTFERLSSWENVESVVKRATIYVGSRENNPATIKKGGAPTQGMMSLKRLALGVSNDVSSTVVRRQLMQSQHSEKLSQAVNNYIIEQHIYS